MHIKLVLFLHEHLLWFRDVCPKQIKSMGRVHLKKFDFGMGENI
jgi:hypothetical protein